MDKDRDGDGNRERLFGGLGFEVCFKFSPSLFFEHGYQFFRTKRML